jgi:uncharacterized Ntn-hydrolase superfamily protein
MLTGRKTNLIAKVIWMLGVIFALAMMGTVLYLLYIALSQDRSTYSIIAVDPATGDVGVAGASCVPISATSLAVLVPGQGAAAVQAAFIPKNQTKVFDLLGQGKTASEIIRLISNDTYDSMFDIRQYGAVTMHEGNIQVAGFTGNETPKWSGDQQDSTYAVSVQGNTLESEAVVSDALAAFSATDIGSVEFPDRLVRALEAASAAGGDRRCNNPSGFQQTAEAAFIVVAKADQPSFITPLGKEPSPNDPALPWLYISVIEAKGGPNPLLELRSRYDAWRSENLPRCADCNLDAILVPSGGTPKPFTKAILNILNRIGLALAAVICSSASLLLVVASLVTFFKRRRRSRRV